jgi:MFS family permease
LNDLAIAPARSPWIGFSAVSVGTFMATLDGSIVNVALPTITRELHSSLAGVEWIVAAYLLVISAALLTAGRLGDLFGHRLLYAGGLHVFTAGSGLCGLAPGLAPLVGARAVQALGACAMMAMAPAIVTSIFPAAHRGRALGMVASVVALGLTAGPPLGGFIVQHLSWRWIFFVNSSVMGTLPRAQLGSGGGILATARNLGMMVGVSVASALFRARAGEVEGAPEGFLAGYRAALLTCAAFALAAGVVALARDGNGRAGEEPRVEGAGMRG